MKVIIIGFGSIGKRHYEILNSFNKVSEILVVTKQDIEGIDTVKSLKDIKVLSDYDYFVIASITSKHFDDLDYVNLNVKDKLVLVEKPLFNKTQNLKKLNNKIFVGYNLRFHPFIKTIKEELLDEKVLYANLYAGQYLPSWRQNVDYRQSYSSKKSSGGGIILDYSHDIDLINFLFSDLLFLESVHGKLSDLEVDVEDYMSFIGKTKTGVYANLTLDSISKIQTRRIILHTNSKTINCDLINNVLQIGNKKMELTETLLSDYERNYTFEVMHSKILNNDFDELCTYKEGQKVLENIEMINNSNNLGKK